MKVSISNFSNVKTTSGFTLIEIMVVIAIIAVVSATTVSTYINGNADRRVRGASRELYAGFRQAVSSAVDSPENVSVTIAFDLAAESYTIVDSNGNGIANHAFSASIDLYSLTGGSGAGANAFTFTSRGTRDVALSGKVKIQYGPDNNAATRMGVRVTSAGGISLIDERDTNWP
ncbi:MAG: prepilin-type N-terminal cleavage/methylation domain-containing protein [Desulfobacteraceae bacterium]|nr:prepilin-type N-terminal cleavage/methylation domain-containing protein [Desulfobacteraceae bacterium]